MLLRTIAVFLFLIFPAYGLEGQCVDSKKIDEFMERNFKEFRVVVAPTDTHRAMTIYARKDLSKWTLVIHYPQGVSCIKGSGYNLEIIKMVKGTKV